MILNWWSERIQGFFIGSLQYAWSHGFTERVCATRSWSANQLLDWMQWFYTCQVPLTMKRRFTSPMSVAKEKFKIIAPGRSNLPRNRLRVEPCLWSRALRVSVESVNTSLPHFMMDMWSRFFCSFPELTGNLYLLWWRWNNFTNESNISTVSKETRRIKFLIFPKSILNVKK